LNSSQLPFGKGISCSLESERFITMFTKVLSWDPLLSWFDAPEPLHLT
jgi:hypothetical protein